MEVIIEAVDKWFNQQHVLHNINLNIKQGMVYGLIGPNGAGKTTLTRILLDIYQPTSGYVSIQGIKTSDSKFIQVRSKIGCVLDQLGLYKTLTAGENIEFFHRVFYPNSKAAERSKDIDHVLKMVDLYHKKDDKIIFFSRGMRQRLALARAFINKPELLILDEPTRGLDVEGTFMLRNYIEFMKKEGLTVLINSHNLSELKKICDKYGFIKHGNMLDEGSYEELVSKYYPGNNLDDIDLELLYQRIINNQASEKMSSYD